MSADISQKDAQDLRESAVKSLRYGRGIYSGQKMHSVIDRETQAGLFCRMAAAQARAAGDPQLARWAEACAGVAEGAP